MQDLKNTLKEKMLAPSDGNIKHKQEEEDTVTSKYFSKPFWEQFYQIECSLNADLSGIELNKIIHIYNPIVYAADVHCAYLRKYLNGPKKLVFVGMNPGPNGMAQNGIPFGNLNTVKQLMQLGGQVEQPPSIHPKRPITGLSGGIEEPSGVRIWTLLNQLSGGLDIFSRQCFVHNFCPLALFDCQGKNITPGELKGKEKTTVRDICLKYMDQEIRLLQPEVVVAVGGYVGEALSRLSKQSNYAGVDIKFLQLAHPSPRTPNNNNWVEKATHFIKENDLLKYLRDESKICSS